MFGEGVVVQVAADEMKDRYVLLLQLGRDPALNWTVGEMGPLQYWITPASQRDGPRIRCSRSRVLTAFAAIEPFRRNRR
jgi:hypothetical protein